MRTRFLPAGAGRLQPRSFAGFPEKQGLAAGLAGAGDFMDHQQQFPGALDAPLVAGPCAQLFAQFGFEVEMFGQLEGVRDGHGPQHSAFRRPAKPECARVCGFSLTAGLKLRVR